MRRGGARLGFAKERADWMKRILCMFVFLFLVVFRTDSCGAAERVALMLEGADPKALPNSFNGLCYSGLEKAGERYGKRIQTKVYNSYGDDNILAPLLRSASSESDLVIVTSALYVPALKEMKNDFPECSYIVFDSRGIEGVTNIVFREEEGGFLAGALAALMTQQSGIERINDEKVIGIILGEKVPPAQRFYLGYKAGSWYASPEVEVLCEYTGSFTDGSKVEAAAAKLSGMGADVIFCAAGPASNGAIRNAERGGYWCIGVDSELETEFQNAVLASVVKRSGLVVTKVIESYMSGSLPKDSFSIGLAEGCVDISTWTREAKMNIPIDVREDIDEIAEKIKDGLIVINERSYSGITAD